MFILCIKCNIDNCDHCSPLIPEALLMGFLTVQIKSLLLLYNCNLFLLLFVEVGFIASFVYASCQSASWGSDLELPSSFLI